MFRSCRFPYIKLSLDHRAPREELRTAFLLINWAMPGKASNSGGGRSRRWSEESPRDRPPMEMSMTGVGEPVASGVVDGLRRRDNGKGGGKGQEERLTIKATMKRNTRDHSSTSTTTILGTVSIRSTPRLTISDRNVGHNAVCEVEPLCPKPSPSQCPPPRCLPVSIRLSVQHSL